MSLRPANPDPPCGAWRTAAAAKARVALVALLMLALPGCRGCFRSDEDPEAEKHAEKLRQKEKPQPDFELGRLQILLRDEGSTRNLVKPGHWMTATQAMTANNFDFHAELESAATDRNRLPVPVQNTAFRLTAARPVVLPKGQTRVLETTFFVPDLPPDDELSGPATIWLRSTLRARRGGRQVEGADEPATAMPAYQYFFVVLADTPERYAYLKRLDSIAPPVLDEGRLVESTRHYRVVLPSPERRVPLPSDGLSWTPIAYVLWDGLRSDQLSPDQQQALLDWLHWGGQIVVSGPGSLDLLRGSFLEPYLPAVAAEARPLHGRDFDELNQGWSLPSTRQPAAAAALVVPEDEPLVGVRLQPQAESGAVPASGGLVWERPAGAGRVVVTAFSLAARPVLNWGSFDSFFNACLLRRPPRVFRATSEGETSVQWVAWPDSTWMRDARFVTGLRYFSRDAVAAPDAPAAELPVAASGQPQVAGWNDTSQVSEAARQTLREAAGIAIPEAGFVFRVLVIYLLVLVPVNWLVFRLLGRVEWAWLAAPLIAIVGGVVVVRLAQLDIGFARSRTEIAVLEVQAGYPAAHLTRYTALYTSLSTAYDFSFEGSAAAMPFPHRVPYAPGPQESLADVSLRRDRQLRLSGFQVASNSTGLVHSEQRQDLGGVVHWTDSGAAAGTVHNGTSLVLQDAGVLRATADGQLELAWIGRLAAGQSVALHFRPAASADGYLAHASEEARQTLGRLLDLACRDLAHRVGAVRLVAWTDQALPGLEIRPQASQQSVRTLVLVHLCHRPRPAPRPDQNLRLDVADQLVEPVAEQR